MRATTLPAVTCPRGPVTPATVALVIAGDEGVGARSSGGRRQDALRSRSHAVLPEAGYRQVFDGQDGGRLAHGRLQVVDGRQLGRHHVAPQQADEDGSATLARASRRTTSAGPTGMSSALARARVSLSLARRIFDVNHTVPSTVAWAVTRAWRRSSTGLRSMPATATTSTGTPRR